MGKRGLRCDKKEESFTEQEIQALLSNNICNKSYISYEAENLSIYKQWESDYWLLNRSGYATEYEIKISKNDFKNDFKHKIEKHNLLKESYSNTKEGIITENSNVTNVPNSFYYVVPEGLVKEEEVPEYAGLIYVKKRFPHFYLIKVAPLLNKNKTYIENLNLLDKFYYNYRWWKEKAFDIKKTYEESLGKDWDKIMKKSEKYDALESKADGLEKTNEHLVREMKIMVRERRYLKKLLKENRIDFKEDFE